MFNVHLFGDSACDVLLPRTTGNWKSILFFNSVPAVVYLVNNIECADLQSASVIVFKLEILYKWRL